MYRVLYTGHNKLLFIIIDQYFWSLQASISKKNTNKLFTKCTKNLKEIIL